MAQKIHLSLVKNTQSTESSPVYNVSQINELASNLLERSFNRVYIQGEVSKTFLHSNSGHMYFTLKDETSSVECIIFKTQLDKLKFDLELGLHVKLLANLGIYKTTGKYQLTVYEVELEGEGLLNLQFKQLYSRLEQEGLFAEENKFDVEDYLENNLIKNIAVITARNSDALQDFITLSKKENNLNYLLYDVPVSRIDASSTIAAAVSYVDSIAEKYNIDLILLTRGGGSAEDLWAFNSEELVRAIFHCQTPTMSAIGHENDITLADYSVDLRASTPSNAAEIINKYSHQKKLAWLKENKNFINDKIQVKFTGLKNNIDNLKKIFFPKLENQFLKKVDLLNSIKSRTSLALNRTINKYNLLISQKNTFLQSINFLSKLDLKKNDLKKNHENFIKAIANKIALKQKKLGDYENWLTQLNGQALLQRGYAMVYKNGKIISAANELAINDSIAVQFADGTINAEVKSKE